MHTPSLALALILSSAMASAQLVIAHRGSSSAAPENTLPAFQLAWEQGADGIEGDFRQTRDGHVIAIHDDSTKGHGDADLKVAGSTLEELNGVDAGSWKDAKFAGTRLPTLGEVIATVPEGKLFFIEIKDPPEIMAQVEEDLRAAFQAGAVQPEQIRIISFKDGVIAESRRLLPEVPALLVIDQKRIEELGVAATVALAKKLGAAGLDIQQTETPDPALVAAAQAAGLQMHTWTIDDPAQAARFFAAGFTSVTTNRPDKILGARPPRD